MRYLLIISILLLTTSCNDRKLTKEEQQQIISEVEQMMQHYCDDVKANGLTAEFKYLDSSDDFFWIPPGYTTSLSYDSIAAILRTNAPLMRSVVNTYDSLTVMPIDKERAAYTASVTSTGTDTAGNISTAQLIEIGVVIKRKDGWKLLSGNTTAIK